VFHNAKANSNPVPKLPREGTRNFTLSHPNIVSVIDIIYNKQGYLCLVMPFCIGGNLRTFMQQEAKRKAILPTDEVNCMGIQILRAIAFLHNLGIAHGDLSPEHILLTARGAVKVGGFGEDEDAVRDLARLSPYANSTSSRSRSSSDKAPASQFKPVLCIRRRVSESATPYLPPERFSSRRESVRQGYWRQDLYDIRAGDIWACGMIYMVLRSGQLPWRGAQAVNPDKSYSEYLHCRRKEDGFGPIQVLENVSYTWPLIMSSWT
jgi:serine/threonine protein kinase